MLTPPPAMQVAEHALFTPYEHINTLLPLPDGTLWAVLLKNGPVSCPHLWLYACLKPSMRAK